MTKSVGILIYDDVEVLDFTGPFEVFSTTKSPDDDSPLFQVHLIAESDQAPITTVGGMRVMPHVSYDQCPALDILLVPGGVGSRRQMLRPTTLEFVKRQATTVSLLTSVCTGALVLAKAGLLNGKTVTTHWTALDLLQEVCPECTVDRTKHWVVDGNLMASAGISAGIDMSLKVVERCYGEKVARRTAKTMEYRYPETNERRIELES